VIEITGVRHSQSERFQNQLNNFRVADDSGVDGDRPVCEDSYHVVREKTGGGDGSRTIQRVDST
jgi:hypothetical protein